MEAKKVVMTLGFIILIIVASWLAYDNFEKKRFLEEQALLLNSTIDNLTATENVRQWLNQTVAVRDANILQLQGNVAEKEQVISHQESVLQEIKDVAVKQQQEIAHLKEVQENLNEEGKIIVDQWGPTLILYDNVAMYESQSPFMSVVKDDPINFAKIGIPFIYFKDESKDIEDGKILGTYSTLYNYIYIYKDNTEPRTIYHEIAHIIYMQLFIKIPQNKQSWEDFYQQLKDANVLSTEYAKVNEIEGFAEEYSVYKTKVKDQPEQVKSFFKKVDELIN
ncbi:MAG: hypothetical protein Q7R96_01240 [Nanoarchaeota archaeon]|nr:hypothetical protein [Nanoarchaeota archaeon]